MAILPLGGEGNGSFASENNMMNTVMCPFTYSTTGDRRSKCIGSDRSAFRSNVLGTRFWCGLAEKPQGLL